MIRLISISGGFSMSLLCNGYSYVSVVAMFVKFRRRGESELLHRMRWESYIPNVSVMIACAIKSLCLQRPNL